MYQQTYLITELLDNSIPYAGSLESFMDLLPGVRLCDIDTSLEDHYALVDDNDIKYQLTLSDGIVTTELI